jgi:alpha-N-acetylglucosamine transferase
MWLSKANIPKSTQLKIDEAVLSATDEQAALKEEEEKGYMSSGQIAKLHEKKPADLHQVVAELEESVVPGTGPKGIQLATKLATQLQNVHSKYPLVILTNSPKLIEIKHNETLKAMYPNVVIRQIKDNEYLEHTCGLSSINKFHFQKIQVFGLAEWDKLIWMDLDMDVNKNMDSVFDDYDLGDGSVIYGQSDNWNCEGPGAWKSKQFCSGMMLFKPDPKHVEGLKEQGRKMKYCWGDQKLIASYYQQKYGRTKKIFPKSVVNWGHCGGKHSMVQHNQIR